MCTVSATDFVGLFVALEASILLPVEVIVMLKALLFSMLPPATPSVI